MFQNVKSPAAATRPGAAHAPLGVSPLALDPSPLVQGVRPLPLDPLPLLPDPVRLALDPSPAVQGVAPLPPDPSPLPPGPLPLPPSLLPLPPGLLPLPPDPLRHVHAAVFRRHEDSVIDSYV